MTPRLASALLSLLIGCMFVHTQNTVAHAQTSRLAGPWPKKHFDEQNTGQSNLNGPSHCVVKPKDGFPIQLFTGAKTSVTVGPEEQLFLGLGFRPLCAFSPDGVNDPAANASEGPGFLWCTQGGGDANLSSPTVALDPEVTSPGGVPPANPDLDDVIVYMGARDNKLWAVKPVPDGLGNDYTVKWRYKICLDGDIFSSVNVDPDSGNVAMTCGCVGNGALSQMEALPVAHANTIDIDNCATSRDDPSGERQWFATFNTDSRQSSPALKPAANLADRRIYVCDNAGTLYSYQSDVSDTDPNGPEQQSPVWQRSLIDTIVPPPSGTFVNRHSSPVVKLDGGDPIIYIGSSYGLHAVRDDGTSSTPLWSYDTADKVESTPALASDGTVYVGDLDGIFYALNSDGTLKWSVQLKEVDGDPEKLIRTSPAIGADGTIYVAAKKTIFALDPANGSTVWSFESASSPIKWSSPAIGSNGILYVPANRKLYAFVDDLDVTDCSSGGGGNNSGGSGAPDSLFIDQVIAPKFVTLTNNVPVSTKRIKVKVKNGGATDFTVNDLTELDALVKLAIEDLNTGDPYNCASPTPILLQGSPQKPLPHTIKPNKTLLVHFDVPFDCANDKVKSTKNDPNHEDFNAQASLHDASGMFDQKDGDHLIDINDKRTP